MKKYPGIRRLGPKRFRIRVTSTCRVTGRRREVDRIVRCANIREALRAQAELREELFHREESEQPGLDMISVRDYVNRWFERRKPRLKYSTRLRYAAYLDQVCDGLGDVKMANLNPAMVSDFLADQAERYSGWTCLGLLRVMRTMTRDAQAELGLDRWACERVSRPKPVERYTDEEPNALTADELRRLWVAMRESEPRWFPLFAVMATTGMRFAEATALKWSDIETEAGVIRVRRNQYQRTIGTPKTAASRRRIPLVAELVEILEGHRERLEVEGNPGLAEDWVFPTSVGTLLSAGVLRKPLDRAAKRARIEHRITPHGLRRTLNTLALPLAPAETIRSIMGHTTSEMTQHYNAPGFDARREVLGKVAELITKEPAACGDPCGDPEPRAKELSR